MDIIKKLYNIKENMPDLQIKEIVFGVHKVYVINIQTVSNSKLTNEYILDYLSKRSFFKSDLISSIKNDINNYIPSVSFVNIDVEQVTDYLFNGFSVLIYNKDVMAFETRASLERTISEPSSEPTIKGPKDSFVENYNINIGLIRKRLKDENLYIKELVLGTRTKTKIGILYMNDIVDKELLDTAVTKIKNIKTDKILDVYYIKALIASENKSSFPTMKLTEKPDIIAKCLTDGKICIISENSNNAMIIPTFFFEFFYYDEDNYQHEFFSKFARIVRLFSLFITIYTPSIYLAIITFDHQILPTSLLINFAEQRSGVPFPAIIEAFILMFTFELLFEGDSLTPTSRGTSLSILGALILGDAVVKAGIVSPIMVIVVAITAISSIFFVYYDFQSFARIYRYGLMLIASVFGIIGVLFGFLFMVTDLCSIKSFGKPFLLPISPVLNIKSRKYLIRRGLLLQSSKKGEQ
jgi:spore germination protein KA